MAYLSTLYTLLYTFFPQCNRLVFATHAQEMRHFDFVADVQYGFPVRVSGCSFNR